MLKRGLTRNLLIFLGNLVDEIDANTYSAQMQRIYCNGWYKRSSIGPTISKMLSVGDIEKIVKDDKVYYRLSSRGSTKIKEGISLFELSSKTWDGKWRLVIFDIEEQNRQLRDKLRIKLRSLNFGMWQESIYISPFNLEQEINEFLVSCRLSPRAFCLVARRSDLGNDKLLADKIWHLSEMNTRYEELIEDCLAIANREKSHEFKEVWIKYQELIGNDPNLPRELLPDGWKGEIAKKQFRILCKRLI